MQKNPAYVAAKGGVIALTRSLALDHAEQEIRVNCIATGAIRTPLMKRNRRQEEIDWMANANLVGRIGVPHDIAAMVAFLSSDEGNETEKRDLGAFKGLEIRHLIGTQLVRISGDTMKAWALCHYQMALVGQLNDIWEDGLHKGKYLFSFSKESSAAYAAGKIALQGLVSSVAKEVARHGVNINAVILGNTPLPSRTEARQ